MACDAVLFKLYFIKIKKNKKKKKISILEIKNRKYEMISILVFDKSNVIQDYESKSSFLGCRDLSYNYLTGRIPRGVRTLNSLQSLWGKEGIPVLTTRKQQTIGKKLATNTQPRPMRFRLRLEIPKEDTPSILPHLNLRQLTFHPLDIG